MAERLPAAADGAPRAPATALDRVLRWQVVLPLLALVLVLTVLFTPATDRPGDSRLTTRSTEPQGAQALFEIARRLGWRVERRDVGFGPGQVRLAATRRGASAGTPAAVTAADVRLDTTATYAVLDPPTDLTAAEAGALLDAVRRGASLLVALRQGATLGDSLHIQPSQEGATQAEEPDAPKASQCTGSEEQGLINWPTGRIHSYWLVPRAPLPRDTTTFASVTLTRSQLRARRRAAEKRAAEARERAARDSVLAESTRLATPPRNAPARDSARDTAAADD